MDGLARRLTVLVALAVVSAASGCSTVVGAAAVPAALSSATSPPAGSSGPASSSDPATTRTTNADSSSATSPPAGSSGPASSSDPPTTRTTRPESPSTAAGAESRSTSAAPGPATEVIELSPLATAGKLKSAFTAAVQGDPISGCAVSSVSRTAGVYQCGPSALYAPACWPKDVAHLFCMTTPDDPSVRVFALDGALPTDPPIAEPLPWALKLANGALCSIRIGGAWGGRADGYTGAYACTGGISGDVVLVAPRYHTPIDDHHPLWTVTYGPLGPNGNETFPAPQHIAVITAWFAVNHTPGVPPTTAVATSGTLTAANASDYGSAGYYNFKSPSGNVYCEITTKVHCEIFSYDFTGPTPAGTSSLCPQAAAAAPNHAIIDESGRSGPYCTGDPGEVHPKVLPYGASLTVGLFRCLSATTGVECRSTSSGHGFAVARAAMRFF